MRAFERVRTLVAVLVAVALAIFGTTGSSASTGRDLGRSRPACTITGTDGEDRLRGTPGPDVICGRGGADSIESKGGEDLIFAGAGQDIATGGPGADTIRGEGGRDILYGDEGRDELFGGTGRDDARGGLGRDRIVGGAGSDFCLSAIDDHPGDRVFGGSGSTRRTGTTATTSMPWSTSSTSSASRSERTTARTPSHAERSHRDRDRDPQVRAGPTNGERSSTVRSSSSRSAGVTIGRASYEPGWVWSEHVGTPAGEVLCQVEHVGLVVSGRAAVRMADGTEGELTRGDLFAIGPGHDSWVVGDEPYVSLHLLGANEYAKHERTGESSSEVR